MDYLTHSISSKWKQVDHLFEDCKCMRAGPLDLGWSSIERLLRIVTLVSLVARVHSRAAKDLGRVHDINNYYRHEEWWPGVIVAWQTAIFSQEADTLIAHTNFPRASRDRCVIIFSDVSVSRHRGSICFLLFADKRRRKQGFVKLMNFFWRKFVIRLRVSDDSLLINCPMIYQSPYFSCLSIPSSRETNEPR